MADGLKAESELLLRAASTTISNSRGQVSVLTLHAPLALPPSTLLAMLCGWEIVIPLLPVVLMCSRIPTSLPDFLEVNSYPKLVTVKRLMTMLMGTVVEMVWGL